MLHDPWAAFDHAVESNPVNAPATTSLLVCDTPAVSYILRRALACDEDVHVVRILNKPSLMHDLIAAVRPSVVILDLSVLCERAADTITELAARCPDLRIVAYGDERHHGDALDAGADAFVAAGAPAADICEAVRGVHSSPAAA